MVFYHGNRKVTKEIYKRKEKERQVWERAAKGVYMTTLRSTFGCKEATSTTQGPKFSVMGRVIK